MGMIGRILITKAAVAIAVGMIVDLVLEAMRGPRKRRDLKNTVREAEYCDCAGHGMLLSALKHTVQIAVFLFLKDQATLLLSVAVLVMCLGQSISLYRIASTQTYEVVEGICIDTSRQNLARSWLNRVVGTSQTGYRVQ